MWQVTQTARMSSFRLKVQQLSKKRITVKCCRQNKVRDKNKSPRYKGRSEAPSEKATRWHFHCGQHSVWIAIPGVPNKWSSIKISGRYRCSYAIISENQWVKLDSPKLASTEMIPTNYDGSRIQTLCTFTANISRGNKSTTGQYIVVKSHRTHGLLGCGLITNDMSNIKTLSVDSEYLPTIRNSVVSIELVDKNTSFEVLFCKKCAFVEHSILLNNLSLRCRCLRCHGYLGSDKRRATEASDWPLLISAAY